MLLVGMMESGKTNDGFQHLLITYHRRKIGTPFYSQIFYSLSVVEDDETYSTFKKALKTSVVQIPSSRVSQFLNEHIRVKKKHCAIYKFRMNNF
jgi:hypothetical protein